jgi:hypothetical protein
MPTRTAPVLAHQPVANGATLAAIAGATLAASLSSRERGRLPTTCRGHACGPSHELHVTVQDGS